MSAKKTKKKKQINKKEIVLTTDLATRDDVEKLVKNDGSIDIEQLMSLIGNDVDLMIIKKLSKVPRYASDLAIDIGISKPAIKKHLDKLMHWGVILPHSRGSSDSKKEFYCINPNLGFTFRLDLSSNYFNYRVENTAKLNRKLMDKLDQERSQEFQVIMSAFGDEDVIKQYRNVTGQSSKKTAGQQPTKPKSKKAIRQDREYMKKISDLETINQSLIQLGRALREVESSIKDVEKERLTLLMQKNELIARIKNVLNTIIEDPMERELISSFFYKTVESFEHGINIKHFLEDVYLKFKGSRAGVNIDKKIPEYITKQEERVEVLEGMLTSIIKGFKFIRTVHDPDTNEEHIIFDL